MENPANPPEAKRWVDISSRKFRTFLYALVIALTVLLASPGEEMKAQAKAESFLRLLEILGASLILGIAGEDMAKKFKQGNTLTSDDKESPK